MASMYRLCCNHIFLKQQLKSFLVRPRVCFNMHLAVSQQPYGLQNLQTQNINSYHWLSQVQAHRNFSIKQEGGTTNQDSSDSDSDSDSSDSDSDSDNEKDINFPIHPDDVSLTANYRDMVIYVPNARTDRILQRGLDAKKGFIEDNFWANKIYKNGKLTTKKHHKMRTGDCVDVKIGPKNHQLFRRVRISKIDDTNTEKLKIYLRCWRSDQSIEEEE